MTRWLSDHAFEIHRYAANIGLVTVGVLGFAALCLIAAMFSGGVGA